ncbi:MAG: histidyl-tRNA synthetase [Actinomycetia bacterium]|nr:histidyl-tRNA synthetase [Actinomycetes bacterium]
MPETYKAPTGTHDVLPPESARWQALEARFAELVGRAGYGLLKTPLFEDAGVFHRVGEATDVVRKEMYDFEDKGGRKIALRPEGTASVARAFVQHRPTTVPWKVWYSAPMFRYERPQAGRYRQHQQLGLEALGSDDADLDVEVIALLAGFYEALGLQRILLIINSLGDENCKPRYLEALSAYLADRRDDLCDEHRQRAAENPLRVLDCKRKACIEATRNAPRMVDHLCGPCKDHFERVQAGLGALGISYAIETRLVRGLDYYTRTTFEFQASALEGAQNAIGGGGRYNGLVESLGGPPTPGIGFGSGIERVLLACDAEDVFPTPAALVDAFVVDVAGGEAARDITAALRRAGIAADRAFDGRSMKSQMKAANRSGARFALLVGEDEVATDSVTLRHMWGDPGREETPQERIQRANLIDRLSKLMESTDD